jgi:head-tail adaptor
MKDPGLRDTLITIQRGTPSTDDYGGDTMSWATLTTAYARIRYGSGQERREAAQERATQSATFECDWNPTLDGTQLNDRLFVNEYPTEFWDIVNKAPLGKVEIHFAAIRSS